jgi:hypothetical protein
MAPVHGQTVPRPASGRGPLYSFALGEEAAVPGAVLRRCSGPPRARSRGGGRRMAERALHLLDHVIPLEPDWPIVVRDAHDDHEAIVLAHRPGPRRAPSLGRRLSLALPDV